MLTISLNSDKQPFFFLPSKLHLSWEKPGPIEVDEKILTPVEISWLVNAKDRGVLSIDGLDAKPVEKPVVVEPKIMPFEERRYAQQGEADKLLKTSVANICKMISKNKDLVFLRFVKEQESNNKNRASVIQAANDRINYLSKQVSSIIGLPLDDSAIVKDKSLPDVEEVPEKTVTVQVGE
jgi:hypothetical protein